MEELPSKTCIISAERIKYQKQLSFVIITSIFYTFKQINYLNFVFSSIYRKTQDNKILYKNLNLFVNKNKALKNEKSHI